MRARTTREQYPETQRRETRAVICEKRKLVSKEGNRTDPHVEGIIGAKPSNYGRSQRGVSDYAGSWG